MESVEFRGKWGSAVLRRGKQGKERSGLEGGEWRTGGEGEGDEEGVKTGTQRKQSRR